MGLSIKNFWVAAILCVGLHPLHAQDAYPSKPVRVVVTASAGATSDLLARAVSEQMGKSMGQAFVVENRPGAGGNVAGAYVSKQRPDGYTILLASVSSHAINHSLYANPPYDPIKDFTSIAALASSPNALIANPALPVKSTAELVEYARKNATRMSYSSGGVGTSQHLSAELFRTMAGLEALHIPYKGSPEAIMSVARGEAHFMFPNVPNVMELAKAGTVRMLAVTSAKRLSWLPDVPTVAEAGLPGFEATAWFGFVGPAGMPKEIVDKLNVEARKAMDVPEVRRTLTAQGFEVIGGTPLEFQRFISAEMAKWAKVVSASGAKAN
jgi:tripartite-type tricarboxylate transporter receptor subunit TctC